MEAIRSFFNKVFLFVGFTFLPIVILIIVSWFFYSFANNVVYEHSWTNVFLLLLSTFLGGVVCRQVINLNRIGGDGMGLVIVFMLSNIAFAWLTYKDLGLDNGVYSKFLPEPFTVSLLPYVYSIPFVGLMGLVFSKNFWLELD